jgi:Polysaccharide lyase
MRLAIPKAQGVTFLALAVGLLALAVLALSAPAPAHGKVRVAAKVSPSAPAVHVVARASRVTKRVLFFVDGRRKGVRRSVGWKRGRKGVLRIARPGRHRLVAVAIHPRGKRSRDARTIRLTRRDFKRQGKGGGKKIGLRPARPVAEPQPEPEPEPGTDSDAPLPPGVLFDGGFDDGFDSWYVQALSYRVSIGPGFSGSAARFEVHDGDVEPDTGSERAEVSGPSFYEGQDLYVRDTIRVPSSSNSDTGWQLIQQLRENDWCCSPGMAVFLDDDRELSIGPGDGDEVFWEGPELAPDRWYDLVYRVNLSQDDDQGFVEVWLDGAQQRMYDGETRIYGQTIQRPSNYIKAGIYRSSSSTGTTVVDHDNVIVGTSYAAVMNAG